VKLVIDSSRPTAQVARELGIVKRRSVIGWTSTAATTPARNHHLMWATGRVCARSNDSSAKSSWRNEFLNYADVRIVPMFA